MSRNFYITQHLQRTTQKIQQNFIKDKPIRSICKDGWVSTSIRHSMTGSHGHGAVLAQICQLKCGRTAIIQRYTYIVLVYKGKIICTNNIKNPITDKAYVNKSNIHFVLHQDFLNSLKQGGLPISIANTDDNNEYEQIHFKKKQISKSNTYTYDNKNNKFQQKIYAQQSKDPSNQKLQIIQYKYKQQMEENDKLRKIIKNLKKQKDEKVANQQKFISQFEHLSKGLQRAHKKIIKLERKNQILTEENTKFINDKLREYSNKEIFSKLQRKYKSILSQINKKQTNLITMKSEVNHKNRQIDNQQKMNSQKLVSIILNQKNSKQQSGDVIQKSSYQNNLDDTVFEHEQEKNLAFQQNQQDVNNVKASSVKQFLKMIE